MSYSASREHVSLHFGNDPALANEANESNGVLAVLVWFIPHCGLMAKITKKECFANSTNLIISMLSFTVSDSIEIHILLNIITFGSMKPAFFCCHKV